MEKEKKKNGVIILLAFIIGILAVLCLLFATGTIDFKSNKISNDTSNDNTTNNDNSYADTEKSIRTQLESIENEYLFILYGYTNLSEVDNQSIMKAILINSSFYLSESFTKTQLDTEFKKSVLSKLSIKHEDFWHYGYNNDEVPSYTYDQTTGLYKSNFIAHGSCGVSPVYKKVLDYSENDGEYVIKYKYVWNYKCDGPPDEIWYGNYMDAKNQKNAIFTVDMNKYEYGLTPSDIMESEIDNNWQSIEDKLDIYTYTFKYEDNHLVLTNFIRTES